MVPSKQVSSASSKLKIVIQGEDMKGRTLTVLIVSKGGKAPVSFCVSVRLLCLALSLLLLAAGGIAALIHTNYTLSAKAARIPMLESENVRLRAELAYLEEELAGLGGQVAELEALGQEIRGLVSGVRPSVAARGGSTERPMDAEETLSYLRETVPQQAEELELLIEDAEAYREEAEATPDFRPVAGRVTSPFGRRRSPFSRRVNYHTGVDFGAPYGTPVHAAAAGTVIQAGYHRGYGKLIIIEHGTYTTYYAHLRKYHVKKGDTVEKGQKIGEVGSTGYSTGPHLHFEIHKDGIPINPMLMLE